MTDEPKTWTEVFEPLVVKLEVAAALDGSAHWNGVGSKAFAKLIREVTRVADDTVERALEREAAAYVAGAADMREACLEALPDPIEAYRVARAAGVLRRAEVARVVAEHATARVRVLDPRAGRHAQTPEN